MAKYKRSSLLKSSSEKNSGGILTTLWRKLLINSGLVDNIDAMIMDYMSRSYDPESEKKLNSTNLREYIYGEKMTIKTFIILLTKLLKTKKIVFKVEIEMSSGKKSHAELSVDTEMMTNQDAKDQ